MMSQSIWLTVPELDAGVTDAIVGTAAKNRCMIAAGAFQ